MNKKESAKKQKTKKELLEELTALRQELENVQSTQRDLKKDKEAQEEKGIFLSSIFSAIREGISVLDSEMNILFVNPTIERWNPHVQPLVGRKCYQAYHGRSQRCELCPCFETLQTGQPAKETLPSLDAQGEIAGWIQQFSYPLLDSQTGQLIGVIEYIRNITEQKQTKEALNASEERYRTIIETIEDGYFEVDLAGNLTYFNDTMVRIFEYPRAEMLGMNNRQYTDAANAKILYEAFNGVYRTGEPSKGTHYEIITKGGGRKNLESSVSLIRDSNGNPVGFRGIVRDVTELNQAQKALQASEERFRIAAESTNDFIYEWDLQSGQIDWSGTCR